MNRKTALLIFFLALIIPGGVLRAQQANFSISPPPIAYQDFEPELQDVKVRATYFSISGDGIDMGGGGMNMVHRISFTDMFAFDYQVGAYYLKGTAGEMPYEMEMNMWNIPLGGNLEGLLYKGDNVKLLIFGGINYTFLTAETGMDSTTSSGRTTTTTTTVMDMSGQMYGGQAGVQAGFRFGDFRIDPYAFITRQQGSFEISMADYNMKADIDPFITTSYGLDIAFMDITLSSIMQLANKSGDNSELKTYIFSLGWHLRF